MSGKFKLITGLGNKDKNKVKSLVLLWAKAGADIFDVSPSTIPDIEQTLIENGLNLDDFDFCTSYAIKGDTHGKKAKIDPILCKLCNKCKKVCIEGAIEPPNVNELKCIGCSHCKKACKYGAISLYDSDDDGFFELLKKDVKLDTVEIHISIKDKKIIKEEFKKIIKALNNSNCAKNTKISICFNRTYFSNNKTEKILEKLKELSGKREFMVQTDGNSMNGANNTLAGTIEAVAFGLFVKSLGYDVILSGGCNEFSAELANKAGLICSIGYGSFARKMTENLPEDEKLKAAKEFVRKTKELLNDKQC